MDLFKFFSKKQPSKDVATSRLKMVIAQDRLNMSEKDLELMKTDILKVIRNYVEIDEDTLDIQISKSEGSSILVANIPVKKIRKSME